MLNELNSKAVKQKVSHQDRKAVDAEKFQAAQDAVGLIVRICETNIKK